MHSATLAKREIAFEPSPINHAIGLINAAEGRAVVAHLPTLGTSWPEKFGPKLEELKAVGLWGVEAFSSEISEAVGTGARSCVEALDPVPAAPALHA